MSRTMYPLTVTNDEDAVEDRTVLLPVSLPASSRPDRALMFGTGADATPIVVRMTPRRQGDEYPPAFNGIRNHPLECFAGGGLPRQGAG